MGAQCSHPVCGSGQSLTFPSTSCREAESPLPRAGLIINAAAGNNNSCSTGLKYPRDPHQLPSGQVQQVRAQLWPSPEWDYTGSGLSFPSDHGPKTAASLLTSSCIQFALLFNPKRRINTDSPNGPENTEQKERKPNYPATHFIPASWRKRNNKFNISRLTYCSR